MKALTIDPCADDIWSRLVKDKESDVFQSPNWLRALRDGYGLVPRASVLVDDSGGSVAGFAFCDVDGVKGERRVSLPFSDYSDPPVASRDEWEALKESFLAMERPTTLRSLHNRIPAGDQDFVTVGSAKWHGIEIHGGEEEMWSRIGSSARRAVRKARDHGLEIGPGNSDADLRSFFELHVGVRKYRLGLLSQPYRFFQSIAAQFLQSGDGVLMVAKDGGEVVAGVLFLEWAGRLYYKFNAWDSAYSSLRPNDALMWSGIVHAIEKNLELVDLGLSDSDQEGLVRYKRKYASDESDILFLRSKLPEPSPWTDRYAFVPALVELLTAEDVPDRTTERAGELLYKLFA